jgi:hypothetical protein
MDYGDHAASGTLAVLVSTAIHRVFAYFDNKESAQMGQDIAVLKAQQSSMTDTHLEFKDWLADMQKANNEQHQAIVREISELTGFLRGKGNAGS